MEARAGLRETALRGACGFPPESPGEAADARAHHLPLWWPPDLFLVRHALARAVQAVQARALQLHAQLHPRCAGPVPLGAVELGALPDQRGEIPPQGRCAQARPAACVRDRSLAYRDDLSARSVLCRPEPRLSDHL